jgi:hypothetical protein
MSLPDIGNWSGSEMSCFFKKLDDGQSPPLKKKNCWLTSFMLCSVFWISSSLKMGMIGHPEMSVVNRQSLLRNIS